MYGDKFFDEILESLLPCKWSRWIAGLTIPLSALSWYLQEFLQGLGLQFPTSKKLLPHIIGPVTLLFLASFILLVMTVLHIKKSDIHFKEDIRTYRKQRIIEFRNELRKAKSFEDIRYSPTFIYLEKKLPDNEANNIANSIWVVAGGGGDGQKLKITKLLELVDNLEKEWGLI